MNKSFYVRISRYNRGNLKDFEIILMVKIVWWTQKINVHAAKYIKITRRERERDTKVLQTKPQR